MLLPRLCLLQQHFCCFVYCGHVSERIRKCYCYRSCIAQTLLILDFQQITECFQRAVGLVSQNTFCKNFAKLYALLVEAVYIP